MSSIRRLVAEKSVLTVIDMQDGFAPIIPEFVETTRVIGKVIDGAKILGIPVVVTEQYPRGLKRTTEELLQRVRNNGPIIEKQSFSSCGVPSFREHLAELGRPKVIVCGLEGHICVMQTSLDLLEAGYEVFILVDGVATRFALNKEIALRRLEQAGAVLVTMEMLLFEWMRTSACPQFREVQDLIR